MEGKDGNNNYWLFSVDHSNHDKTNHHDMLKVLWFIIKSITERCSCSDKGERAGAGERAEVALHTHTQTYRHVTIFRKIGLVDFSWQLTILVSQIWPKN